MHKQQKKTSPSRKEKESSVETCTKYMCLPPTRNMHAATNPLPLKRETYLPQKHKDDRDSVLRRTDQERDVAKNSRERKFTYYSIFSITDITHILPSRATRRSVNTHTPHKDSSFAHTYIYIYIYVNIYLHIVQWEQWQYSTSSES